MSKKTLKTIKEQGCVGLIQVKSNQPTLLSRCQRICNNYNAVDKYIQHNMGHGRSEKRTVYTFTRKGYLDRHIPKEWIQYIKSVVCLVRDRTQHKSKGKGYQTTREVSYYVCTEALPAKDSADAIRKHWEIENRQNYVRDESMGEDKSRIRKNPQNMMILKSIALNSLRSKGIDNIRKTLYRNSLNLDIALLFIDLPC